MRPMPIILHEIFAESSSVVGGGVFGGGSDFVGDFSGDFGFLRD